MEMKDLSSLINLFIETRLKYLDALFKGTRKDTRKFSEKFGKCWTEIQKHGEHGREELSKLFNHESRAVRCGAAGFLLKYKHEEAKAVLEKLQEIDDFVAFEARECLKRWEEGEWALDD